ncbi:hypothetical protein ANCDUO_06785 [Ancylostoma duodenale]|uniref:Uncharacterized protein n=1 Tax=Ancylostoma duodenale TaxID=51022 RepID=A0A0C2H0R8_9BILA|nr:hypothetical protein ANCDUO_06785 [Ancylostoma duodenale]
MATLQYEFAAPKLLLAEGSHCVQAGTYVVYDGAIVYKCVQRVLEVRSRGKREVSSTTAASTTEMETTTGEDTTTNSESTTTKAATTSDTETTPEESTTPGLEPSTRLPITTDAGTTPEPETTTKSSPDEPSTNFTTTANPKTTPEHEATTKSSPEAEVKAEQFQITGAVVVETPQPIFESQWNLLAAEIQAKLEKHRVLFTEDIRVELF